MKFTHKDLKKVCDKFKKKAVIVRTKRNVTTSTNLTSKMALNRFNNNNIFL